MGIPNPRPNTTNFFATDLAKGVSTCKKCGHDVPRTDRNTSGLLNHLKRQHIDLFEQLEQKKVEPEKKKRKLDAKAPNIKSALVLDSKVDYDTKLAIVHLRLCSPWILSPTQLWIGPDFETFATFLLRDSKSRTSLMRKDIPELFEEYKSRVQDN
ncbi:hypothetical protein L596_021670 [Steinernema carpocapsae]|uniref:BED-type domain-containing protein n=1 Tax=Steinernema carpocapsae TaxID=34508 RepID=A0A4U5MJS7_STECR|nr:hypothetical protein L596_021670 [Steinernema carpocapsae]